MIALSRDPCHGSETVPGSGKLGFGGLPVDAEGRLHLDRLVGSDGVEDAAVVGVSNDQEPPYQPGRLSQNPLGHLAWRTGAGLESVAGESWRSQSSPGEEVSRTMANPGGLWV